MYRTQGVFRIPVGVCVTLATISLHSTAGVPFCGVPLLLTSDHHKPKRRDGFIAEGLALRCPPWHHSCRGVNVSHNETFRRLWNACDTGHLRCDGVPVPRARGRYTLGMGPDVRPCLPVHARATPQTHCDASVRQQTLTSPSTFRTSPSSCAGRSMPQPPASRGNRGARSCACCAPC